MRTRPVFMRTVLVAVLLSSAFHAWAEDLISFCSSRSCLSVSSTCLFERCDGCVEDGGTAEAVEGDPHPTVSISLESAAPKILIRPATGSRVTCSSGAIFSCDFRIEVFRPPSA